MFCPIYTLNSNFDIVFPSDIISSERTDYDIT